MGQGSTALPDGTRARPRDGPPVERQPVVDGPDGLLLLCPLRPPPEAQAIRRGVVVERVEVEVPRRRRQAQGPRPVQDTTPPTIGEPWGRPRPVLGAVGVERQAEVERPEAPAREPGVVGRDGRVGVVVERVDNLGGTPGVLVSTEGRSHPARRTPVFQP